MNLRKQFPSSDVLEIQHGSTWYIRSKTEAPKTTPKTIDYAECLRKWNTIEKVHSQSKILIYECMYAFSSCQ